MFRPFVIAALAGLFLTGPALANVEFDCGVSDGVRVEVTYFEEEDVAGATLTQLSTGRMLDITLFPTITGSGALFVDPATGLEFREHQGRATFTGEGRTLECSVIGTVLPGGAVPPPAGAVGFDGFSFGGNLRAGPGIEFADIGSLQEGQPVILLEDSGVFFNGFSFWRIELPGGQTAYHWGGILCAPGVSLPGIFNDGC